MPVSKEFIVLMDDTPGALGKVCRALADRNVNILGLDSFPIGGKAVTRFVVDSPTAAKAAFEPGEIGRVATRLGESKMNINYAYCGLESGTNTPLIFFGVADAGQAAPILDQAAAAKP